MKDNGKEMPQDVLDKLRNILLLAAATILQLFSVFWIFFKHATNAFFYQQNHNIF
jgi:hypothetical protein